MNPGKTGSIGAGPTPANVPDDVDKALYPTEVIACDDGMITLEISDVTWSGLVSGTLKENSTGTPMLRVLDEFII